MFGLAFWVFLVVVCFVVVVVVVCFGFGFLVVLVWFFWPGLLCVSIPLVMKAHASLSPGCCLLEETLSAQDKAEAALRSLLVWLRKF